MGVIETAAWVSNGAFLVLGLPRTPAPWRLYLFVVACIAMLDAWLNGALSPLPGSTAIAIAFVILGDLRYFYTLTTPLRAAALAFVVPLAQAALLPLLSGRGIFACYEALFLLFASLYRKNDLTPFVLVTYASWLSADLLLIAGVEQAMVLREMSNVLYYGGFTWFVFWRSSRSPLAAKSFALASSP